MVQSLNPQVIGTNVFMTAIASSAIRLVKAILAEQLVVIYVETFLRGQIDITFGTQETFVMIEMLCTAHSRLKRRIEIVHSITVSSGLPQQLHFCI